MRFFSSAKSREPVEPPYLELQRDFLEPAEFYQELSKHGVSFYAGVPDSLLKDFCAYVQVPIMYTRIMHHQDNML